MSDQTKWQTITSEKILEPEFGEQRQFQTESFYLTQEDIGIQLAFLSNAISSLCNLGAKRFDMQIEAVGEGRLVICCTAERNPL